MPVQIDHMETAIEIANPGGGEAAPRGEAAASRPTAVASMQSRVALATTIGDVMAAELDRFLKTRGMG